ncbi:multidrug efflux SMR transporter [Thalassobacillus sp. CUG 92003]|uniref:DMT family transporter n=1 Tax=Thalassobacillus sp. CUG 92003 TaxID=2736641 RepID=UPI0015E67A26|nr:multidrug efflux SMR transporter [Thalassobacillus sp. CUG 92003]
MAYVYLFLGIVAEVFGTTMLKMSEGLSRVFPVLGGVVGFSSALFFLALSFQTIPLNVAYATWAGVGTAGAALVGLLIWKENINLVGLIGLILIIGGIVLLNLSPGHASKL